jgi:hypothetical protein
MNLVKVAIRHYPAGEIPCGVKMLEFVPIEISDLEGPEAPEIKAEHQRERRQRQREFGALAAGEGSAAEDRFR